MGGEAKKTPRRKQIGLAAAVIAALAFVPAAELAHPGTALAQGTTAPQGPPEDLGVSSWALVDPASGRYLAGENPDERRSPAATATIMTALVALERAEDLDAEVVVPEGSERFVGFTYSNVGLITGERLSVRELLKAAMISSGTDATYALADHVGYGDTQHFVDQMNDKARELGLEDTHFENPTGIDEEGNYSTARDLAEISRTAMQDPRFAEIVGTREATISTQTREIDLFNTNELLYAYPASSGIKTGSSAQAGSSMIASAERDGESYIAVILDAGSSEEASAAAWTALQHGFDAYGDRPLVHKREAFAQLPLPYKKSEKVTLVAGEEVEALVAPDSEVERRVTTRKPPEGAPAGHTLGSVEVFVEGAKVGESPLVTAEDYLRPSVWDKARLATLWPFERLSALVYRYASR